MHTYIGYNAHLHYQHTHTENNLTSDTLKKRKQKRIHASVDTVLADDRRQHAVTGAIEYHIDAAAPVFGLS